MMEHGYLHKRAIDSTVEFWPTSKMIEGVEAMVTDRVPDIRKTTRSSGYGDLLAPGGAQLLSAPVPTVAEVEEVEKSPEAQSSEWVPPNIGPAPDSIRTVLRLRYVRSMAESYVGRPLGDLVNVLKRDYREFLVERDLSTILRDKVIHLEGNIIRRGASAHQAEVKIIPPAPAPAPVSKPVAQHEASVEPATSPVLQLIQEGAAKLSGEDQGLVLKLIIAILK